MGVGGEQAERDGAVGQERVVLELDCVAVGQLDHGPHLLLHHSRHVLGYDRGQLLTLQRVR